MLKALPKDTGMAFVLVQHLDPTHASQLTEILSHATTMPVAEAGQGMQVLANHVYVIPPNRSMFIKGRVLQLEPRAKQEVRHLPVDYFFRSLAAEHKNRAIGIILSGTATDGAEGMRAIKDEGGITFAQDPHTAKYYGMPQSAIAAGAVDFVLTPEEIGAHLARIGSHSYMALPEKEEGTGEEALATAADGATAELFRLLKKSYGVDFRAYKFSTLDRRIKRRMAFKAVESFPDYVKYVTQEPEELRTLFQDMLIGVTEFFRQPGMFEHLKRTVFPALLKNRPPDAPIRIWVVGCSTGEEGVGENMEILHFRGHTGAFLEPAPGVASLNLLKMVREGLLVGLRAALDYASKKDVTAHLNGQHVEFDGRERIVDIHVVPVRAPGQKQRTFLVLFEDATPLDAPRKGTASSSAKRTRESIDGERAAQLKQELAATKAYLQSVIENQEATNEELRP